MPAMAIGLVNCVAVVKPAPHGDFANPLNDTLLPLVKLQLAWALNRTSILSLSAVASPVPYNPCAPIAVARLNITPVPADGVMGVHTPVPAGYLYSAVPDKYVKPVGKFALILSL